MTDTPQTTPDEEPTAESPFKPLRAWPGLLLVVGMLVLRYLPNIIKDGPASLWMAAAFGPALCSFGVLIWWLAASRATWRERLIGAAGLIVLGAIVVALLHKTMLGPAMIGITIPMGVAGLALGASVLRNVLSVRRTVIALAIALAGFSWSLLLRGEGMWGNFQYGLSWRWEASPEEQLLAEQANRATANPDELKVDEFDVWLANPEWPAFRGAAAATS